MYLSLDNVTVRHGRLTALDRVSFSVKKEEIFGLIGPNGSGKSTTLKVIIGLLRARGKLKLEGKRINPDSKAVRRLIGYCPQENSFFDKLTVRENIAFFANLYGVKGNHGKKAESLAKAVGIGDKLNEQAHCLSGGMRRRLNLACSIVHSPSILLLDEPSVELDPFSRMTLWRLIKEINRSGTTVIISTNAMEEADYLCDRVAFLVRGKLRYSGPPGSVTRNIERKARELE